MHFHNRSQQTVTCTFLEPLADAARLTRTIAHKLQTTTWYDELISIAVALTERGELTAQQMTFFDDDLPVNEEEPLLLTALAQQLKRYAGIFYQGELVEATHVVAERRSQLRALG